MCASDIDMMYLAVYGIVILAALGILYIIVITIYANIEYYFIDRKKELTKGSFERGKEQ